MIMDFEIEEEFHRFLEDIVKKEPLNEYLDVNDYEKEYSHNDIDIAQEKLYNIIAQYLKDIHPNQYCVMNPYDWCVRVLTIEEAKNIGFKDYEEYIIKGEE